jgi:cytochrome P450
LLLFDEVTAFSIFAELLDAIEGQEELDIIPAFARPFPFRVITRLLGIPLTDEKRLLDWALKLIDYPWDPEGAMRAKAGFDAYMLPLIAERRASPGDDLVSLLATAQLEGQALTDEEIGECVARGEPAARDAAGDRGCGVEGDRAHRVRARQDPS